MEEVANKLKQFKAIFHNAEGTEFTETTCAEDVNQALIVFNQGLLKSSTIWEVWERVL